MVVAYSSLSYSYFPSYLSCNCNIYFFSFGHEIKKEGALLVNIGFIMLISQPKLIIDVRRARYVKCQPEIDWLVE
jgi:hypothetical protein